MMKSIARSLSRKIIASGIALSFVMAAFLGAQFTMNTGMEGEMQNCPFLGQQEEECSMTVVQHASQWQQLLLATFQSNTLSELLLALAAMASAFVALKYLHFSRSFASSIHSFSKNRLAPFESNYLLEALREGILRKRE